MPDLTLSTNVVTRGKRVCCRYKWLDDCEHSGGGRFMDEGTVYVSIKGWGANGSTQLCICSEHAQEFFKQITGIKRELKKLKV